MGDEEVLELIPAVPDVPSEKVLLRSWDPPHFPARVRLYGAGDNYYLWNEDAGWFGIEPSARRLLVPPDGNPVRREERIWGLPVMLCFLGRGDLALHASCVEIDGQALVLAAPRRYGKTTLAAAFASAGYRVLAEDLVCIRPGPAPMVIPGPAMLRPRSDMADALEFRGATALGRDADRLHLALSSPGSSAPLPLAGIAILLEGDTDPVVERTNPSSVVADLWYLAFKLPKDGDMQRCLDQVVKTAFATRTWNLTRRLRVEDLNATIECLVNAVRSPVEGQAVS